MLVPARIILAATAIAAACTVLASAADASPDNSLACELVSITKMEQVFGLPHEKARPIATSPTAASPNDHTVTGSDEVECDVLTYRIFPSPAVLLPITHSIGEPNVPAGIGYVIVTTNVRDDTNAGDNGKYWDPDKFFGTSLIAATALRHQFGGGTVSGLAKYAGQENSAGMWIGNKNHALGLWEIGGGVISIDVVAAGGTAPAKLVALANLIVPKFTPFAGS